MRVKFLRAVRRIVRTIKPDLHQPDWRPILRASAADWQRAIVAARTGPRVLIATSVGGHVPSTTLESLLAVALTLRGAHVQVLLCDRHLPACLRSDIAGVSSDNAF